MKRALSLLIAILLTVSPATALRFSRAERLQNLQAWYDGYNHEYFNDELPKDTHIADLHDDRFLGLTEWNETGFYQIDINLGLQPSPKTERETELHEMCHLSLVNDSEFDSHGPKFQACMRRLAASGAFDDLW